MRASGWIFLALSLTLAAPVSAETSRLASILTSRVLRVGTTGDYRPRAYPVTQTPATCRVRPFAGI